MELFLIIFCSYLMGSIPFGYLLTKFFLKKDIRDIGSGNIGATNVLRTGNKVIGYTGEGGKEYWKEPIFTVIKNGEFLKFTNEIIKFIKKGKNDKKFILGRNKLIESFSPNLERKKIIGMLNKISSFF